MPFGYTRRGGGTRALGNPGVYWPVAAFVLVGTLCALRAAVAALVPLVGYRGMRMRASGFGLHCACRWAVLARVACSCVCVRPS